MHGGTDGGRRTVPPTLLPTWWSSGTVPTSMQTKQRTRSRLGSVTVGSATLGSEALSSASIFSRARPIIFWSWPRRVLSWVACGENSPNRYGTLLKTGRQLELTSNVQ